MLQVNNATVEKQATQMAYVIIQNQELRAQIDNATTQLATLQTILQKLTSTNGNNNTDNHNGNNNRNGKHRSTKSKNQKQREPMVACCWTHVDKTDKFHNSRSCLFPADVHTQEATLQDVKGGNTRCA